MTILVTYYVTCNTFYLHILPCTWVTYKSSHPFTIALSHDISEGENNEPYNYTEHR